MRGGGDTLVREDLKTVRDDMVRATAIVSGVS